MISPAVTLGRTITVNCMDLDWSLGPEQTHQEHSQIISTFSGTQTFTDSIIQWAKQDEDIRERTPGYYTENPLITSSSHRHFFTTLQGLCHMNPERKITWDQRIRRQKRVAASETSMSPKMNDIVISWWFLGIPNIKILPTQTCSHSAGGEFQPSPPPQTGSDSVWTTFSVMDMMIRTRSWLTNSWEKRVFMLSAPEKPVGRQSEALLQRRLIGWPSNYCIH